MVHKNDVERHILRSFAAQALLLEDLPVGRPHKESNMTAMTQPFFGDAALGRESKVLEAVRQDGNMLDLQ
jgi:hypothetical protein